MQIKGEELHLTTEEQFLTGLYDPCLIDDVNIITLFIKAQEIERDMQEKIPPSDDPYFREKVEPLLGPARAAKEKIHTLEHIIASVAVHRAFEEFQGEPDPDSSTPD